MENDLSTLLVTDTEFYLKDAPYVQFLNRHNINTVKELLEGDLQLCSFNGHKMHKVTYASLRALIRLLKYKYYNEPLLFDAYFDTNVDLSEPLDEYMETYINVPYSRMSSDIYHNTRSKIVLKTDDQHKIFMINVFGTDMFDAINGFINEVRHKEKYPKIDVKFIAFFKWLFLNLKKNEGLYDKNVAYIAEAYLDSYYKDKNLTNNDPRTINMLKNQLQELFDRRDTIDKQIAELKAKITELSNERSNGVK